MPSETFYCPHCKRSLTKSAQAYVLGEIMSNKSSSFAMMGQMAETVTCPGCGGSIGAAKMVRGEYDLPGGAMSNRDAMIVFSFAIAAFVAALLWLGTPWWVDFIIGLLAGGLVMKLLEYRRGQKNGQANG